MMPQGRTQQQQEQNSALIARMLDARLVEIDIKKVGKYVKSDLFERMMFLWDQKALEVDGMLHKDYITNCKSLVGDIGLIDAASYMICLWNKMTERECYCTRSGCKQSGQTCTRPCRIGS
jgi:hypothetical protein